MPRGGGGVLKFGLGGCSMGVGGEGDAVEALALVGVDVGTEVKVTGAGDGVEDIA